MKPLRFAPIVRVSTEQQEKQGESLKTQTVQISQYVKSLNGTIPKHCWQYSGQEHATPGQERTRLDKLLSDSSKGLFDAVIVCDTSRWSRDNLKSKEGLNILRNNNIRFFAGTTEYDLYNPAQNLFLGMSAEIGEYQAREQALKSITNRINRAKRGIPTAGKLPYGRTWDKKTEKWDVDNKKKKLIQQAAERYLSGESMQAIANSLRINHPFLHKTLTQDSGTVWTCHFRNDKLNINEMVEMKIPHLLDQQTIEAIQERARINKTYIRGNRKYRYLLSGAIFCSRCGYAMASYANHSGRRYYRHRYDNHKKCSFNRMIRADELETSVLLQLVQTFGDPERIEQSIQRYSPDLKRREQLQRELNDLTKRLKVVTNEKQRLVRAVAKGSITDDDVRIEMEKLSSQKESTDFRVNSINDILSNIPDADRVRRLSKLARGVIVNATRNNSKLIFKRDYKWRRRLIEHAFSGTDREGRRLGIYVDMNENDQIIFKILGNFDTTMLALPLTDYYLIEAFKLDPEYCDVKQELQKIRESINSNMFGKCNAYHCRCIYK